MYSSPHNSSDDNYFLVTKQQPAISTMQSRLIQQIATSIQNQPRHFGKATSTQQSYVGSNCLKIPASSLRVPYAAQTYDSTYATLGSIPVDSVVGQVHPKVDLSSLKPLAQGMRVACRSRRLQIQEEIAGWNVDAVEGVAKTLRSRQRE